MAMRPSFTDALTWMDIHGDAPDVVDHWQQVIIDMPPDEERSTPRPRACRAGPPSRNGTMAASPGDAAVGGVARGRAISRSSFRTPHEPHERVDAGLRERVVD